MKRLSRQTVGKSAATKSRLRRKAVAKNLAIGMKPEEALLEAGYSPTTARKKAYRVIRHPEVQSLLTESVTRVLTQENKKVDDIVRPYVKALDATVVVKMPAAGMVVQTSVVDHSTRMAAATHLIGLYSAKGNEVQEDDAGSEMPPIVYQINFIDSSKHAKPVMINRPTSPSGPTVTLTPQLSLINGKR
jgi:Terminase small subunit